MKMGQIKEQIGNVGKKNFYEEEYIKYRCARFRGERGLQVKSGVERGKTELSNNQSLVYNQTKSAEYIFSDIDLRKG